MHEVSPLGENCAVSGPFVALAASLVLLPRRTGFSVPVLAKVSKLNLSSAALGVPGLWNSL